MSSAVVIFTKIPIPGLVKTRLTQDTCLSELDAAKLAEAMLKDTISLASMTKADGIQIGYFPQESVDELNEIINSLRIEARLNLSIDLILQSGSDFNQRFGSIVKESFRKDYKSIVMLGADLPYLDPKVIDKALLYLTEKFDQKPVIIGPSTGGGIYLVGITSAFNFNWFSDYNLFRDGSELSKFAKFCNDNKFPLISLPPYGDIDIEEDLVSLISYIDILENSEITDGFYFPYYTAKILEDLKLRVLKQNDQTRQRKIAKNSNR
ncbi:MAG: DUF2064 domain-containing protein [Candidatus Hermodarchaeota archaeon]